MDPMNPPPDTLFYYRLRYTPEDQTEEDISANPRVTKPLFKRCRMVIFDVIKKYSEKWTYGAEWMNSKGYNVKFHYHIHFTSTSKPDAMRKAFVRYLQAEGLKCSGLKSYMLKVTLITNSVDAFFQYPLKQYSTPISQDGCVFKYQKGFTLAQIENMRIAAHACWQVAVQVSSTKTRTIEQLDSVFLRAVSECKKIPLPNMRNIKYAIIKLYMDEDRPINMQTINGYANTVALKLNVITIDELIDSTS